LEAVEALREELADLKPVDRWHSERYQVKRRGRVQIKKRRVREVNHVEIGRGELILVAKLFPRDPIAEALADGCAEGDPEKPVLIQAVHAQHLLELVDHPQGSPQPSPQRGEG